MPRDYLDHLSTMLRCSCLSDLRYRTLTDGEAQKLLTEPEEYPVPQYLEAARYILTDSTPPLATAMDAKKAIVAHMS